MYFSFYLSSVLFYFMVQFNHYQHPITASGFQTNNTPYNHGDNQQTIPFSPLLANHDKDTKKLSTGNLISLGIGGLVLYATLDKLQTKPEVKIMGNLPAMLSGAGICMFGISTLLTYKVLQAGGFFKPDRNLRNIIKQT